MWLSIQENNTGIKVMGVRWLWSQESRRGNETSPVIYTRSTEIVAVRMGGKHFRIERYDWKRGRTNL